MSHRLVPTVRVTRAIFGARAASVLLLEGDELVFTAVAGDGEGTLEGRRIPRGTGVAGYVALSRQPIVVEDLTRDARFAEDVAASTGYVPRGLMAAPIEDEEERVLGVLSVLDRPRRSEFSLVELELLGLLAEQAAVLLRDPAPAVAPEVAELAAALAGASPARRAAAGELLDALTRLLRD